MKLGPFEIDRPFLLAPMAGITNSPFRRLVRKMGSPIVVSELVSANGLEYGNKRTEALFHFEEDERPVGLQIFGERPLLLNKACEHVEKLGADFVDLNLGCPVSKVVKKGAGSAMCRDPKRLERVLKGMVESVKIPVTIKIRTGWNSEEINAHDVIQAATNAGVSWVAVHGRTRAQAYEGKSDWNFIAALKEKASIPIIGNGDANTPEKAVEFYKQSGVDAVMIGRAALRNPFIFNQAKQLLEKAKYVVPSADDYLQLMKNQKAYLEDSPFPRVAQLQSKKFLSWYSAGFSNCKEFRQKLFQIRDFDQIWDEGFKFFESRIHHRNMDFLTEDFLMGGHG